MTLDLSFIVPVYNVEEYLEECVNSVLSQIGNNCEIILVDDGSTDNSGKICDEFGNASSQVKVIHKENGGLSSARNAGIKIASGTYIAFLDSDDRLAEEAVQRIITWIHEAGADLCFMDAVKSFSNGKWENIGDGITRDGILGKKKTEILQYLATRPKFPGSACTKIFRYDFLKEKGICFPVDRRYHEDLGYVLECILQAESYDALEGPYYEYRQNRVGSITHTVSAKNYFDLVGFVYEITDRFTHGTKTIDECGRYAMSVAAYEYSLLLWRFCHLAHTDKVQALRFLKAHQWILRFAATKRGRIIRLMSTVVGVHVTSWLLNLYMQGRKKRNAS